jgi:hypothetical protein
MSVDDFSQSFCDSGICSLTPVVTACATLACDDTLGCQ